MLGGATLAVQTVVLGASLFQRHQPPAPQPRDAGDAGSTSRSAASAGRGAQQRPAVQIILPNPAGAPG